MLRFRKIVCPVDFSPISRRALEHAAAVARWHDSELLALHVVPLMPAVFGYPGPVEYVPAPGEAVLRELAAEAATVAPVRKADLVVREGSPAVEILRFAAEVEADLVVLGTHGRTGFERLVLGSVTEKVLRKAHCPVLTVPPHAEGLPERPVFERILCGVDFSDTGHRALDHALSLAQEANGRITLLHVVDGAPEKNVRDIERLEALVPEDARDWCEADVRIACGKPYRAILRTAGEERSDLVVLGVRGAGPADLRFGSTAQHVVRQAECPVLTVRG